MSEKIQSSHIERDAYVYIRQWSTQQVCTRPEGQRRQYDLRERAQALGFQRVVVIDEDLGRSGTGCVELPGFTPPADGCLLGSRGSCVGARSIGHYERVRDQFASTARDGGAPTEGVSWFSAYPSSCRVRPHRRRRHGEDTGSSDSGRHCGHLPQGSRVGQCAPSSTLVSRRETADSCALAGVRSPQGDLDRTGLSPYFRTSEKPKLCRCLRLGKKPYSHFHRGWPRA
jgi:hypothetical protein